MDELQRGCLPEEDTFRRAEVIGGPAPRRRWTTQENSRIVAESYVPGASMTAVGWGRGRRRSSMSTAKTARERTRVVTLRSSPRYCGSMATAVSRARPEAIGGAAASHVAMALESNAGAAPATIAPPTKP